MKIFWTFSAQSDLENIFDYISQDNPQAAYKLYEEIIYKVEALIEFPYSGRPGRVQNTREKIISDLAYVIIYRVHKEMVQVLRILHGAQQWPQ